MKVIQVALNRSNFMRHGMHLNFSGKIKAAKLIYFLFIYFISVDPYRINNPYGYGK